MCPKGASARAFSGAARLWHEFCLAQVQPEHGREDTTMRSIKRDLEQQHTALTDSIRSLGATRDAERGREIVKTRSAPPR